MIADLEKIFTGDNAPVSEQIRQQDRAYAREILDWFSRPLPTIDVADWGQANVRFNEPKFTGAFSLQTRRYVEEPLNLWRRDISNDVTDLICCWATRSAKTRIPMVGAAYRIANDPMRCLWTKPMKHGAGGSRNDAKTKFVPMLRASPGLLTAVSRCDKNALNYNQQMINGSIIDWEGTGSPKQLSGNPDDVVVQDECDGYVVKGTTEAHPSVQADERTKDAANPLRYKSCSPTVAAGVIWTNLLMSDLRRRFIPCPRCSPVGVQASACPPSPKMTFDELVKNKYLVLGWNEQYNVLPAKMPDGQTIPVGYVKWDSAAKGRDGEWDYERVVRTAHVVCPHCQGNILNHEKEWMDERGQWLATKKGAPGFAGFHLSSLYVTHNETAWGILAKKFLLACASGQKMKGFINNDLAEVDDGQEHGSSKVELSSIPMSQPDWISLLTADYHKNWPYIWFVVRRWCPFKLLPPFPITDGKPDFVSLLDLPGNEGPKRKCLALVNRHEPAWQVLAEIMRFKSGEAESPIIEFLLAQNLTGKKLVSLFRDDAPGGAAGNTMDLRRLIYRAMSQHQFGKPDAIRCPRGGDSELIACGSLELSDEALWSELRDLVTEFEIGKGLPFGQRGLAIDCGYQERFNREVLQQCYESAGHFKWYNPMSRNNPPTFHGLWEKGTPSSPAQHQFCQPCPADGWLALRGVPTNRPLGDGKINHELSLRVEDPFYGTADAGSKMIEVLQVPQGLFWLRKNNLRLKRTKNVYGVSPKVSLFPKQFSAGGDRLEESRTKLSDYEKHCNEQYYNETTHKVEPRHGRGGSQSKRHPYHMDDCETYQVARATELEFFQTDKEK